MTLLSDPAFDKKRKKNAYVFCVLVLDFDSFSDTDFFSALQGISQVSRLGQF